MTYRTQGSARALVRLFFLSGLALTGIDYAHADTANTNLSFIFNTSGTNVGNNWIPADVTNLGITETDLGNALITAYNVVFSPTVSNSPSKISFDLGDMQGTAFATLARCVVFYTSDVWTNNAIANLCPNGNCPCGTATSPACPNGFSGTTNMSKYVWNLASAVNPVKTLDFSMQTVPGLQTLATNLGVNYSVNTVHMDTGGDCLALLAQTMKTTGLYVTSTTQTPTGATQTTQTTQAIQTTPVTPAAGTSQATQSTQSITGITQITAPTIPTPPTTQAAGTGTTTTTTTPTTPTNPAAGTGTTTTTTTPTTPTNPAAGTGTTTTTTTPTTPTNPAAGTGTTTTTTTPTTPTNPAAGTGTTTTTTTPTTPTNPAAGTGTTTTTTTPTTPKNPAAGTSASTTSTVTPSVSVAHHKKGHKGHKGGHHSGHPKKK